MNSEIIWKEEEISSRIFLVRNQKIMLDSDLAELYGVPTKRLNEQVKRNLERFPVDFMFQITEAETEILRSHFATSRLEVEGRVWGGRRNFPYAFTEHGAIMLASVLKSPKAISASIFVVRAFVRLRQMMAAYQELNEKLKEFEESTRAQLGIHDEHINMLFRALNQLIQKKEDPYEPMGFKIPERE